MERQTSNSLNILVSTIAAIVVVIILSSSSTSKYGEISEIEIRAIAGWSYSQSFTVDADGNGKLSSFEHWGELEEESFENRKALFQESRKRLSFWEKISVEYTSRELWDKDETYSMGIECEKTLKGGANSHWAFVIIWRYKKGPTRRAMASPRCISGPVKTLSKDLEHLFKLAAKKT